MAGAACGLTCNCGATCCSFGLVLTAWFYSAVLGGGPLRLLLARLGCTRVKTNAQTPNGGLPANESVMVGGARRLDRKLVMYAHVHKSGGSTMCYWAKQVGESLDQSGSWCTSNRFHDYDTVADYARSPGPGREALTCRERVEHFAREGMSWNSLEHELCQGDLCFDDFIYGTLLRETLGRITSQVNYEGPVDVDGVISCVETSNATACPGTDVAGRRRSWVYFDNYVIRTFGGCDVANAPPGKVTRVHFDAAVKVLDRFDFVIPLTYLSSRRAQATLDRVLGWHVPPDTERLCSLEPSISLEPAQATRLLELNSLEVELVGRYLTAWESAGI